MTENWTLRATSRGFADESIVMTMTGLTAVYGRLTVGMSIETLGPARAVKRHPQSPQAVTLTPLCGRCQLHFCRSNAALMAGPGQQGLPGDRSMN